MPHREELQSSVNAGSSHANLKQVFLHGPCLGPEIPSSWLLPGLTRKCIHGSQPRSAFSFFPRLSGCPSTIILSLSFSWNLLDFIHLIRLFSVSWKVITSEFPIFHHPLSLIMWQCSIRTQPHDPLGKSMVWAVLENANAIHQQFSASSNASSGF